MRMQSGQHLDFTLWISANSLTLSSNVISNEAPSLLSSSVENCFFPLCSHDALFTPWLNQCLCKCNSFTWVFPIIDHEPLEDKNFVLFICIFLHVSYIIGIKYLLIYPCLYLFSSYYLLTEWLWSNNFICWL